MASDPAIIVTRPSGQARRLIELIQGGAQTQAISVDVLGLPLLTIVPKNDSETVTAISKALTNARLIIFVSPNAIECTMRAITDAGMVWNELISPQALVGVVGSSSRDALLRHGLNPRQSSCQHWSINRIQKVYGTACKVIFRIGRNTLF